MARLYEFITEEEKEQIVSLYNEGLSCRAVGKKVGRADRSVWRVLVDKGIEVRPARRRKNANDYVGTQWNKWTVVRFDGIRDTREWWWCKCECGKERSVRAHDLLHGASTGCRSCCHSSKSNAFLVKSWYMTSVINKAKPRNLEVTVDIEYISKVFEEQNGKCALSGLPLTLSRKMKNWKELQTASLDRVDSSKGYIPGNVQWVHKDINRMKLEFSQEHFIEMCRKVTETMNE